jgi:iron(III) transport system substrate-binding protein
MKHFKQFISLSLAATMLAGCSSGGTSAKSSKTEGSSGSEKTESVSLPEEKTFDELLEAGKKNGKKVTVYSTHSVVVTACKAFQKQYGLEDIEFDCSQIGDTDQITRVATEEKSGAEGADVIFIQDGARIVSELVNPGYVYNWYNTDIKKLVGDRAEPLLAWTYDNKVLIYNSNNVKPEDLSNIWALTDEKFKGSFQMKDPTVEGVNMDFLTEITNDDNAEKLADAYKDYFGSEIKLDSDCPNAGYQFIKNLYANEAVLGTSDGKIAEAIGDQSQTQPWAALITLNKYKKNLDKGLALGFTADVEPFGGFIYPIYALQTKNADNPDLAKAFTCWLFTQQGWDGSEETIDLGDDGTYTGMSGRFGDYSANTSIKVADGDNELTYWEKNLVNCDPEWDAEHRADVEDFITTIK